MMCGILCEILSHHSSNNNESEISIDSRVLELLRNRGPDLFQVFQPTINVVLAGFVLWHQGMHVCRQPIENDSFIFLLNGDIHNINYVHCDTKSDSYWIASRLSTCKTDGDIIKLLGGLEGPFSIIFFNKTNNYLYFARDVFGRNSLLIERESGILRITSSSFNSKIRLNVSCIEVPALGIYKINTIYPSVLTLFPWNALKEIDLEKIDNISKSLKITVVAKSLAILMYNLPLEKTAYYDFYDLCKNSQLTSEDLFSSLCNMPEIIENIEIFLKLLENSINRHIETTTRFCTNCVTILSDQCFHSKISLLFSGGIDCTILAVLMDKLVKTNDPIDLVNVAFQAKNADNGKWDVPDRCTAIKTLDELKKLCPLRTWNFVEVNVSRDELERTLSEHIKDLIYPLNTILDESIGCAFWFASRGLGVCAGNKYKSPSRVVIVGSGADELFGGYTRHRNIYNRCNGSHQDKMDRLRAELKMDWERISQRNLGRDDRVIADNGKTVRAPYIDEFLVPFVRKLDPNQKCCFLLPPGLGDKLFLRLCGYSLGLRAVISERKRAIQFGSRIAYKQQHCNDKSAFLET